MTTNPANPHAGQPLEEGEVDQLVVFVRDLRRVADDVERLRDLGVQGHYPVVGQPLDLVGRLGYIELVLDRLPGVEHAEPVRVVVPVQVVEILLDYGIPADFRLP